MTQDKKENIDLQMTEFLENMRHDIRTPLTGIIGFAQLIQKEAVDEKVKSYANDLVSATTALLDFQNDILDAIQSSPEINPVTNTYFPLKKMVENVINLIKPKVILKQLSLKINYDDSLPTLIFSDYKRLYRILLELITNALKFTARGCIEVDVRGTNQTETGFNLRLAVTDSGIGISKKDQQVIFTRFKRLTPASDGLYEGTGLGLTTVRQFVTDLDGQIEVNSQPTKGATFICDIPVIQTDQNWLESHSQISNSSVITASEEVEYKQSHNLHIQLIEDHPLTAKVTQLLLEDLGCQVSLAENASSALDQNRASIFDLILVDIGLPDMSGFDMAHEVRKDELNPNQKTPIIALTAHIETGKLDQNINKLIDAIFQKPLLKSTAIEILNKHVLDMNTELSYIDLTLGAKRISQDETAAKEMLLMLQKTLSQEETRFSQAFYSGDWETLSKLTHRLRGALAYCGAPHLEAHCKKLDQALKNNIEADIKMAFVDLQSAVTTFNGALETI